MANEITITEALAEIKTIGKRIEKKREFINGILFRQDMLRDPHEGDGGSRAAIAREQQAIVDLEGRVVALRRAIRHANDEVTVTIGGTTKVIADWLTWRREVAPQAKAQMERMRGALHGMREQAKRQGAAVVSNPETASRQDVVVNINESVLASEIESMEITLGELDGQLSLKNATVLIPVA
jgi:hypothetical protein